MEYSHEILAQYVKRAQFGDSNAFAELYSCSYNKVYNYCRHYLRDEFLAQDAVQEIYISALKNLTKLNDPTLFIAWLNQISFHVCYDLCKANKSSYGEADPEMLEEICDVNVSNNPEASAFINDEQARLKEAIAKLTPSEQQLITLRYFNNMKIDEIVATTDISRSTVKRQLQASIDKLKKLMKE